MNISFHLLMSLFSQINHSVVLQLATILTFRIVTLVYKISSKYRGCLNCNCRGNILTIMYEKLHNVAPAK